MIDSNDGIHTTTNPKGTGWANVAKGDVLSTHDDKGMAIAEGRRLARRHGANLTIHRRDGSVAARQSYAPSPIE
jgi:hypothetical protein